MPAPVENADSSCSPAISVRFYCPELPGTVLQSPPCFRRKHFWVFRNMVSLSETDFWGRDRGKDLEGTEWWKFWAGAEGSSPPREPDLRGTGLLAQFSCSVMSNTL